MNNLLSFVRLDFLSIKSYVGPKNLLLFAASACFLTVMSGSALSSVGVGMMFATLLVGYPFIGGEKNNMDALYVTLSIGKKTVVAGRYIFMLVFNLCAVAGTFVLGAVGILAAKLMGMDFPDEGISWTFLAVGAVFIAMQSVQFPIFFKLGYTKARIFSLLPFAALSGVYGIVAALGQKGDFLKNISEFAARLMERKAFVFILSAAVLSLIVYASYCLSLRFYKKREF